jgi:hypothetical protein
MFKIAFQRETRTWYSRKSPKVFWAFKKEGRTMFREMRRKEKMMTAERAGEILEKGRYGMLTVVQTNGYPYAVPVNYVYRDGKVYVHCAKEGAKIDAIQADSKASFTVVFDDEILQERFTSAFESVVAFGKAFLVDDEAKKLEMLKALIEKYSPDYLEKGYQYAEKDHGKTAMIVFEAEMMTGKTSNRPK